GDSYSPQSPEAIRALGFLAAGPWDFIGHAEVPETKTDGKIARHLDRDDMVGTAVGSLMSLTIQCAQCHDHKFDPIKQTDYYQLQAIFSGIDRADRPYFRTSDEQTKYEGLYRRKLQLIRETSNLQKEIERQAGPDYESWQKRIAAARKNSSGNLRPEFGYHSAIETDRNKTKWVQLNFNQPVEIKTIVIAPCSDDFNSIGDGFGFPLRYKIEAADSPDFKQNMKIIADRTKSDQSNPGIDPQLFQLNEMIKTQYIRMTATQLASRGQDFHFALAELAVLDSNGKNLAGQSKITSLDSIEAPPRWQKSNLIDGVSPGGLTAIASKSKKPEDIKLEFQQWLKNLVSNDLLARHEKNNSELKQIETELKSMIPLGMVYAGTVHTGSGAFTGTGVAGGVPRPVFKLNRG
ncbi:MAG: DUF1549 domain-containing protein, partial [Isosphaeraceae bacterium]